MLAFLVSAICSIAILFAGIPATLNEANKRHVENGREPNAGVSIIFSIILMPLIWWGACLGLKCFWGLTIALIVVITISIILFLWNVYIAQKSNRE